MQPRHCVCTEDADPVVTNWQW